MKNYSRQLQAALVYEQAGRLAEAEKAYKRIIQSSPNTFDPAYLLGMLYARQGNLNAAIKLFRRAAQLRPDVLDVHYNLAVALGLTGSHQEASATYERILSIDPRNVNARNNYATTLLHLGHVQEALRQYDELIARHPDAADAYNNRGMAQQTLIRFDDALRDFDKAIALRPDFSAAHVNRGNVLSALRRSDEALESYKKAIVCNPNFADAYSNIGNIYFQRGSYREALDAYDRALSLNAGDSETESMRLYAKLHLCDWRNFDQERSHLISCIHHEQPISPFISLAISSSPDEQFRSARLFSKTRYPPVDQPLCRGEIYSHDRIRVGYLSADFRDHATANLLIGLFEHHDRSLFEITGFSFGPSGSAMSQRIESACDRFIHVEDKTDQDIAELVRQLEIDIAVDPMGYTQGARPGIFARRPCPVQVSYLGYLGTMGSEFIDYVIADQVVLPFARQKYFSEKIVHLPDCFLTVEDRLDLPSSTPSRADVGLPAEGFVFCSFNNSYKFGRATFELWMRLLRSVEGSVLWLLEANADMARNLLREAQHYCVDAGRIVFAPRVALPAHLARQRVADLFLDTSPYNAGATGALALWSGVPILTMIGETFVGRMAASMLQAVGMPELVAGSSLDYEALALKIATEPEFCAALKEKLARARETSALFNAERFARHMEAAYMTMWQMHRNGHQPASFAVSPSGL